MIQEYFSKLDELVLKYSNYDYQGGFYRKLFYYNIDKGKLFINMHVEGKADKHVELIQDIVSTLNKILPKDLIYRLRIDGWYCDITNGDFNLKFIDGNYYIKSEHQEMHDSKEIASTKDVYELNNKTEIELKWRVLKKMSTELGFVPVKDKSGFENLYLTEAFKECYPSLKYDFHFQKANKIEPKKKNFFGLF
jgi:hypothetical protein